MRKKIRIAVQALIALCFLVQVSPMPALAWNNLASMEPVMFDGTVYIPVVKQNIASVPVGYTLDNGVTDVTGSVSFEDRNANGIINVRVRDGSGNPLQNARVYFMSDGTEGRALVYTADQRVGWNTVTYPNLVLRGDDANVEPFTVTLVVIIVAGSLATYHLLEFSNDPPRVDQELGYTRLCMTYDQFKHAAGAGLSVLALHTATVHAGYAVAAEIGVEEFVLEASPDILAATGLSWPWNGYWCFRKTDWHGVPWWTPETDTIQDAEFYAVLRWDKAGTDVDLHVYDSFDNHAYYGDKDGIPGGYLDHDDQDGYGPEIYRQVSYEGARYYQLRVHYYSDHGYGDTTATLQIFDNEDALVASFTRTLSEFENWTVYTYYP